MKFTVRRFAAVIMAVFVVLSGAGLVLGVSTTTSTDNTNAPSVQASDWADDGTTVVSDFGAGSTNHTNISIKVPTANATSGFDLTISHDGVTHYEADENSSSYVLVGENLDTGGDGTSTGNTDVHAWNFSNNQLETVPGAPGENTTVTVNVTNYDSTGTILGTSEFTVDLTFTNDRSVIFLKSGSTTFDNDVEVTRKIRAGGSTGRTRGRTTTSWTRARTSVTRAALWST